MSGKGQVDSGVQPVGRVMRHGGLARCLAKHQRRLMDERRVGVVAEDVDGRPSLEEVRRLGEPSIGRIHHRAESSDCGPETLDVPAAIRPAADERSTGRERGTERQVRDPGTFRCAREWQDVIRLIGEERRAVAGHRDDASSPIPIAPG